MGWFLESIAADDSRVKRTLHRFPFRVGRDVGNDLAVEAGSLSRRHAEIGLDAAGRLCVTDLGSTNGTFVNRERVQGKRLLVENDVLHFGHAEYRLGWNAPPPETEEVTESLSERTMIVPISKSLSQRLLNNEGLFLQLLAGHGLAAAVQPIVDAHGGALIAYELLGRCTHPGLPASPVHLFQMAATLKREVELSAAFRDWGLRALEGRLGTTRLFFNSHPDETFEDDFFETLRALRAGPQAPRLVVEVHETAVMEVDLMRKLAARLATIGVEFAYDDFGAGQSRLNELSEVPPHFVKFDMGLIRDIDRAGEVKQQMVRGLVRTVKALGSVALAEGVETEAEAAICRDMGFQLVQGYLTGRPVTLSAA
ncbi:EAL domain-containing protein [Rubrivivax sp. A210]|uniref:EAL domain-containing protein n=1 Tax=Rubrivivax sp. A210 TaxID=2772301 RepID=UPI001F34BF56|nr:EAL domain-containing protein [Rubrivivax sp. A210]